MAAAHFELEKIIAFLDNNGLQTDGAVGDIMNIEPLEDNGGASDGMCSEWTDTMLKQIISAIASRQRN